MTTQPTRVWLDCDPGHDDAFALMFAALHPGLELVGVSTVHGNQSVEKVTTNALRVLSFLKIKVPVHPGAAAPIGGPTAAFCPAIHGDTGLDIMGLQWPPLEPGYEASTIPAATAIAAALDASPADRPLTIIATGCLTNIATLFSLYPTSAARASAVVIMGGAIQGGNTGPYCEFNIQNDPEAARAVFLNAPSRPAADSRDDERAPIAEPTGPLAALISSTADQAARDVGRHADGHRHVPVVMVPLDMTHTFLATEAVISRVESPLLKGLFLFFEKSYRELFGFTNGPPLHDVCAVAAVAAPELFDLEWVHATVEVANPLIRGMTIVDSDLPEVREYRVGVQFPLWKNVRVAKGAKIDALWDLFFDTLAPVNVPTV